LLLCWQLSRHRLIVLDVKQSLSAQFQKTRMLTLFLLVPINLATIRSLQLVLSQLKALVVLQLEFVALLVLAVQRESKVLPAAVLHAASSVLKLKEQIERLLDVERESLLDVERESLLDEADVVASGSPRDHQKALPSRLSRSQRLFPLKSRLKCESLPSALGLQRQVPQLRVHAFGVLASSTIDPSTKSMRRLSRPRSNCKPRRRR